MSEPRLDGLGVVVTRPRERRRTRSRAALAREGARRVLFPALAIEDVEPTAALDGIAVGRLARFDLAIFVSANAVEKGLALARRFAALAAARSRVAAIGEATAQALRNSGFAERDLTPGAARQRRRSWRWRNCRPCAVKISSSSGVKAGASASRNRSRSAGRSVTYAECYRRVRPDADPSAVVAALARGEVHAVSVLSGETLDNFIAMIGAGAARLADRDARRAARGHRRATARRGASRAFSSRDTERRDSSKR